MTRYITFCVLFMQSWAISQGAMKSDRIKNLPGLPKKLSFKQYSGYLQATQGRMLHYWFLESQNNPSKDPVVVWFNGGPGCSSMEGILAEHGPFLIQDDGKTFKENDYSWNKIANMLYIEAPAGVGYSYKPDNNFTTSDNQTAIDNHEALKYFLKRFKEFSKNRFFVTGESYAGIYVPTLSRLLVDDHEFNFQGFAVGNGVSDDEMKIDSLMYFGYYRGLWGNKLWNNLQKHCCKEKDKNNRCKFYKAHRGTDCSESFFAAFGIVHSLNIYNMYESCYHSIADQAVNSPLHQALNNHPMVSRANQKNLGHVPSCVDATGITSYLNRKDVRKKLHIPDHLPDWTICSDRISYQRQYTTMKDHYLEMLQRKKYRILVYNGDVDMVCNFLGDEWFVDSLEQKVVANYTAWYLNDIRGFPQIAGFIKKYENLNFVTIKGAGHMVPQDKPKEAFAMFQDFIKYDSSQSKPCHSISMIIACMFMYIQHNQQI